MQYLWPEGSTLTRQAPPDDPVLRQIDQALDPIRPLLRGLEFTAHDNGHRQVQIGLGSDFDLFNVAWEPDALIIDLPVGQVFQRPADLLAVLTSNWRREWQYRADSVSRSSPGTGQKSHEVLLVLEHLTTPDQLPHLATLLLAGWRHKILAQATIYKLRGENV